MNTAFLKVSANGSGIAEIAENFYFLVGFAGLMVLGGWLSYRRMLMVERRL